MKSEFTFIEFVVMLGIFGVIAVIIGGVVITFTGFHYSINNGSHVGYVTATETSGIIFKTHTVYVKTDVQSSQEEEYCVIDEAVFAKLKQLSETKSHVEVTYFDWLSAGIANCAGEKGGIISAVNEVK